MKLQKPENENYAATVVRISHLNDLENCDNVKGVSVFGMQAIVPKDTEVGSLAIVFPTETQLSEEYARENNLFRHAELNADSEKTGYLEDNRRVRAMKFRGHVSNALVMPLESLSYIKDKSLYNTFGVVALEEGDTFDQLLGHDICKKYVVKRAGPARVEKNKHKVFKRVDEKMLPEHYDTENYFRNRDAIGPERDITVTQKVHGTSIRLANTIVRRKLSLVERALRKLGVRIQETEYGHVYGSKRVIKDPENDRQQHYYSSDEFGGDIWTINGEKYKDAIPENFVLYGELVGWTPDGAPIQKHYTYLVPDKTADLYIYRVAMITNQGMLVDLSWDQVKEFCRDRGLKTVPELWRGKHKDFNVYDFVDGVDQDGTVYDTLHRYHEEGYPGAVALGRDSPVDEGVCIRVDGIAPYILKAKSAKFLEHETKLSDENVVDLEEVGKEEL